MGTRDGRLLCTDRTGQAEAVSGVVGRGAACAVLEHRSRNTVDHMADGGVKGGENVVGERG